MDDIKFFLKYGWKSIWKQRTIWLFGFLPHLSSFFQYSQLKNDSSLLDAILFMFISFVPMILWYISYIAVPYLAYRFFSEKSTTTYDALSAIKKFSARVIGCSCISTLLFLPVLVLIIYSYAQNPTTTNFSRISNITTLMSLPLSVFNSLWVFTLFGFFSKDLNISQSLQEAWSLFTNHFSILAALGVITVIILRMNYAVSGIITVAIQSGFNTVAFSELNYLYPTASLNNNMLYELLSGLGSIIYSVFSASVFTLAYQKYSGAKISKSLLNE